LKPWVATAASNRLCAVSKKGVRVRTSAAFRAQHVYPAVDFSDIAGLPASHRWLIGELAQLAVHAVPEPSSPSIALSILVGLAFYQRRCR
jgi:hypothetical protein